MNKENFISEAPIEVSARHIHLSLKHLEEIFGSGYKLKKMKDLSLPGMFAAEETLTIKHKDKEIPNVRIIGPCREYSQVEISVSDAYFLDMDIPIRRSGQLDDTPGITIIGPEKTIELEKGVIASWRHIHLSDKEAEEMELKDGDFISIKTEGDRALIFEKLLVRVDPDFSKVVHIDTDEGNAAGIKQKTIGEIWRKI